MLRHLASITLVLAASVSGNSQTKMFHQDVSWSPDGKRLAFTGMYDFDEQRRNSKADIFVINVDGSGMRKITSDDTREFYASWAKGLIAFGTEVKGTRDANIFVALPDGSKARQITKEGRNATPSISRNGKWIAFTSSMNGGKNQLYVVNVDGSGLRRITTDDSMAFYNPQWSPDGKRIVYYSEKGDGKDQIWVMNSDGSNPRLLTGDIGHNIFPGWSADGRKIVFSSSKRESDSSGSYVDGSYLYVMNSDGSGLSKLGDIKSFFARYSPDGKKIAYVAGKFPETAIYIANADGSGAVRVTK